MTSSKGAVFYQEIHAPTPEQGLWYIAADVQKSDIKMCVVPKGKDPYTFANQVLENEDPRVGKDCVACINITKSSRNREEKDEPLWLYFGWEK